MAQAEHHHPSGSETLSENRTVSLFRSWLHRSLQFPADGRTSSCTRIAGSVDSG